MLAELLDWGSTGKDWSFWGEDAGGRVWDVGASVGEDWELQSQPIVYKMTVPLAQEWTV
jgi:hypothetical protein